MLAMKPPGIRFPIVLLNITGPFPQYTLEKPQSTVIEVLFFQHMSMVMLKS